MDAKEKMILLKDINEILCYIDVLINSEDELNATIDSLISMKEKLIGKTIKYSA